MDRAVRRQLRAIVLLVVVVANLVYAVPYPRVSPEDVEDPAWMRAEWEQWAEILQSVGVAITTDELQARIARVALDTKEVVMACRAPFSPFFRATVTNQQWGLFARVTERPDRLVVEVRRGPEVPWERYYARLEPGPGPYAQWDGAFRYRRVRGIWDSVRDKAPSATYRRLARWTAEQVMQAEPDVTEVRFLLERSVLTAPWEEVDPSLERRAIRRHTREQLLDEDEDE